jgi:hypothetical protein
MDGASLPRLELPSAASMSPEFAGKRENCRQM